MKTKLGSFLFILSFLSLHARVEPKTSSFRIAVNQKGQFIDNYNRILKFHGFNSVKKVFPWYDSQILNETRLKLYKEWGFNLVRLGTMWSGVEPNEGQFNQTYIGILQTIVGKLNQYGMFSFLDMHQDVMSSKYNGNDGIPLWLVNQFPEPEGDNKFPHPLDINTTYSWATYYITYAASDGFQNLYKNPIATNHWSNFWKVIAQSFVNNTAVMGYELINEPWFGNFYENMELLLPGYAGRENLLPIYDILVDAIRTIDNDTLIFYEPVTIGAYYPSTGNLGTGFNRVPGRLQQRDKSVLSYHYYCFLLNSMDPTTNYTPSDQIFCQNFFMKNVFESAAKNINETGGGSLLSEFGLCIPDGNPHSINTQECEAVLEKTEEYYQSFTYWDSIFFDSNGAILPNVVKMFARTYPRALQGQPIKYSFNMTSGYFQLSYEIDLTIAAPTEIFIPITVHYVHGFVNETFPFMPTHFDKDNFIFSIMADGKTKHRENVTVIIRPLSI